MSGWEMKILKIMHALFVCTMNPRRNIPGICWVGIIAVFIAAFHHFESSKMPDPSQQKTQPWKDNVEGMFSP